MEYVFSLSLSVMISSSSCEESTLARTHLLFLPVGNPETSLSRHALALVCFAAANLLRSPNRFAFIFLESCRYRASPIAAMLRANVRSTARSFRRALVKQPN